MSEGDPADLAGLVCRALAEDLGPEGDVTSLALVPETSRAVARVVVREAGVLAGTAAATEVFRQVDADVGVEWRRRDGDFVAAGDAVAEVRGSLRSILTAERTALNLLCHLSGVASLTRRFVDAAGPAVTVLDTRKTLPGLRALEKAAVRAGGGENHRSGLSGAVLAKDNHLALVSIPEAVERARAAWPGKSVEVECETLDDAEAAVAAGADRVMLDNMTPDEVAAAVTALAGRVELEVSGGVTLDNVAAYAAAGPDYVSVGALTHSAPALDLSLEVDPG